MFCLSECLTCTPGKLSTTGGYRKIFCSLNFPISYKQCCFRTKLNQKLRSFVPRCQNDFSDVTESSLPPGAHSDDSLFMKRALELSRQALGKTSPNPMVGCVIVKEGEIIGEGFHPKAGEPHAEVFALREAGENAKGATAYVTLEPCNHFGRTPPCSQALVKAKVKRVVVGTSDPNPLVAGNGIKTLLKAGIEVVVGVEEELCRKNVESFICRITEKRPFSTLMYSISLDGKFLGSSSCVEPVSGNAYSKLLQEYDAVIVTADALESVSPLLSLEPNVKQPLRVILTESLDLDRSHPLFDTSEGPTLVVATEDALAKDVERKIKQGEEPTQTWLLEKGVDIVFTDEIDLDNVLGLCYQRDASTVLWSVQGPNDSSLPLTKKLLEEGTVDKLIVNVVPIFVGDDSSQPEFGSFDVTAKLEKVRTVSSDENVVIEGYWKA